MNIFRIKNYRDLRAYMMHYPLVIPAIYIMLYFPAFGYLENRSVYHTLISCPLDQYIPFIPVFVIPYLCWFVLIPGMMIYLMKHDRKAYVDLCLILALCMTVSLVIYYIFPNHISLRHQIPENDFFCRIIRMIRSADTSTNVCPSLHVANTLAVCFAASRSKAVTEHHAAWTGIVILSILIIMSTVLIDQHSVIDVCAGALLSTVSFLAIEGKSTQLHLFHSV